MELRVHAPVRAEAFSVWLDLLRWVSAFVVVVSHAGGIMLLPLSATAPVDRVPFAYFYSFIAGFGHIAVMVFFVLSGYLVGGSWVRDLSLNRARFSVYISKRITRLTIVLYPTLILSAFLLYAGLAIFPGSDGLGVYSAAAVQSADFSTGVCNAVFMQNILCDQASGNSALWSLTHEFWYYVAFPMLLYRRWTALLGIAFLGALTWLQVTAAPILPYFTVWLMGVAVAVVPSRKLPSILLAILLVGAMVAARLLAKGGAIWADFPVGILLALLLVAMKSSPSLPVPPMAILHKEFAAFSYTLYCVHMPVLLFISSVFMANFGIGGRVAATTMTHWLVLFAGIIFAVCVAYLMSLVFERNTERLRKLVMHNLFARDAR